MIIANICNMNELITEVKCVSLFFYQERPTLSNPQQKHVKRGYRCLRLLPAKVSFKPLGF